MSTDRPTDRPASTRLSDMPMRSRIEVMTDRLAIAVDYATTFRASSEPEEVEACERAIRFANMLSAAITATVAARQSDPF
jgi:hypothetical protein